MQQALSLPCFGLIDSIFDHQAGHLCDCNALLFLLLVICEQNFGAYKIERKQTRDSLLTKMHGSDVENAWSPPPPEWYAQMVGILFVLVMVAHLWYKRFRRELDRKTQELKMVNFRRQPRRPPRVSDEECYAEEYM